ncbi:ABC transporter substrate-binding protein [Paenibacillus lycopersici]|uniref:ABC transporter substrate-binding protein n=1 Tax=Paenibacillus lycopersici TaxID=2704462 RepID=A0A6C0FVG8_9BACL|nr:ABC transporter substrate-binding protein [Paenibacillus lycopersici]QHT61126.1 ABC transporter substrate-binding protein [Paenibacillus lycopersici]
MKKVNKAAIASLVLTLTTGALLTGCGSNGNGNSNATGNANSAASNASKDNAAPKEKVVLDFWTFWGSETRRPLIEKIIDDFNKAHEGTIEVKHSYYPFGDIWTKSLAQTAAGNPPDVIVNAIEETGLRAAKKQNTNLADFLAKDPDVKNRFREDLWNTVLYKGDPYALPFTTDTRMMFYNKTAFKEAGLDPDKFPDTWDELEQVAMKLDKKDAKGNYTRIGYAPQFAGFDAKSIAVNFDGGKGWLDENGQANANTPGKIEGFNYVQRYTDRLGQKNIDEFKAAFGSKEANPFIAGKVAIWPDAVTFQTQLRDFGKGMDVGIAPIPETKEGAGHWSTGGGFVVEIPAGAKHPAESWEFIKYLTDVQAQTYWAKMNYDNVANVQASNDAELIKDPVYKASVDNLADTRVYTRPAAAADMFKMLDPQVDAILQKQSTPKEGLDKAQKDIADLIAQNGG